jgi:hypothetical protein
MGHLLSSAIKMQGSAPVGPTLTVNFYFNDVDGATTVRKNGSIYAILFTQGDTVNVPIVAGDTFSVRVDGSACGWTYYINDIVTAGNATFGFTQSPTYTASDTNIYRFETYATTD